MPAVNDLPYFPLHVDDYLNDPAVLAMEAETEGCYIRLLCRSWRSPTPGRIHSSLVRRMGDLWRCADRQASVERQLSAAFDTTSDPGFWIQKRMVIEYRRALELGKSRKKGADATNDKRWGKVAKRSLTDRSAVARRSLRASESSLGVGVGVDSTSEEAEASEPSTNGTESEKTPKDGEETPAQWREGFDWLWEEYPRKVGKVEAMKSYLRLRPRTQATYDSIMAGLTWYKRGEWSGREPDKIPHPATWLNQRRWVDAQAQQQ